jgi:hypothetical protein
VNVTTLSCEWAIVETWGLDMMGSSLSMRVRKSCPSFARVIGLRVAERTALRMARLQRDHWSRAYAEHLTYYTK